NPRQHNHIISLTVISRSRPGIYGFSDNNQSFAYSGSRQPIRACDGQLTCRRALVLGSSDPVTGRRGEQRWLFALATRACALFATYGLQPG
ncbi:hypothetical protein, partial [Aeromonas salmonicida]|uniref:hypothetical protein n=3 Tax=Aeromonas salmonicida TaxID=645 RepID=UPI00195E0CE6